MPPSPSPEILYPFGGSRSVSRTLPLNVALTGPTLLVATARNSLGPVTSRDWQPGMQALRTSGSLSLAHTVSRGAGSCCSPDIVIAIGIPPLRHCSHDLGPWPASGKGVSRYHLNGPCRG